MEKEIVWTDTAKNDVFNIVSYLKNNWPSEVLEKFDLLLIFKLKLLSQLPKIGFKVKSIPGLGKQSLQKTTSLFILKKNTCNL